MNLQTAAYWIAYLNLQPHPEGGYYKEVFRSEHLINRLGSSAIKRAITSIYYLLEGTDFSAFHRIASDELWYFHKGSPLTIHAIDESGVYEAHQLSDEPSGNLSVAIKTGLWFASEISNNEGFALVSCAVAPGFEFSEFEMGDKQQLKSQFTQHADLLDRLCREVI
jgi:predicted cupin superfamily sugar epimerase